MDAPLKSPCRHCDREGRDHCAPGCEALADYRAALDEHDGGAFQRRVQIGRSKNFLAVLFAGVDLDGSSWR